MRAGWFAALALALPMIAAAQQRAAPRSGFEHMSAATQALQRNDDQNPGFLWVGDGQALWAREPAPGAKPCAACHGEKADAMRDVAARYPAWSEAATRPLLLSQRINQCREQQQGQRPWPAESAELLAMEAWVALQSRGLPLAPPVDERLAPYRARGQALFNQRQGALHLSCAQCHAQRAGGHLGASVIPEGHPNGYPTYRLEWQGLGSLERRLRNCMNGVRAEVLPFGAPEYVDLALYLAQRAAGLAMEAPAVRP